ncbi:MAG: hypothetical protein FDZ75_01520, partial [Actinobacteria bacterium]
MSDSTAVATAEEPRVFDTYALVYALSMVLLVPGSIAIGQLPFRTYTLQYVSLVTVPFLVALVVTFMTDSADPVRRSALRTAILTPIVLMTGVAVLFTSSLLLLPINTFLGPEYRSVTAPLAAALLLLIASPLVPAIVRRVRAGFTAKTLLHAAAMLITLVLLGVFMYINGTHEVTAMGS